MTLLERIQESAVDRSCDLGSILRQCKVLAARLGSKPVEDWLIWESDGYPEDVDLPPYRVWDIQLKGHFAGPFGSGMKNAPIPKVCIPEKYREQATTFRCRLSIAGVEETLANNKGSVLQAEVGDLSVLLGTNVYEYQNCIQAWAEMGSGNLVELVNAVRNKVLDFTLALWKMDPNAGEVKTDEQSLQPQQVSQIFNTTVYGGSANLVGSAHGSTVSFEINPGDLTALISFLTDQSVSSADIEELTSAIQSDPKPQSQNKLGPQVSSWIGRMVKKAAEGAWTVGISAAGSLLSDAIAKYYGIK